MAHYFETGFFTRTPAWHKFGIVLPEAPSVADGLRLAGLDWDVEKRDLFTGEGEQIKTHKTITRVSDSAVLGVVGNNYQPLQNVKAFEFFEPFVQSGAVTLEAAGSLKGGKRVWVLGKLKGSEMEVVDNDKIGGYFLLSNAHDGTQAVRAQFTTIRVVCWNTLSRAERRGDAGIEDSIRVRHTANVEKGLAFVQKTLDMANRTFKATFEDFQRMQRRNLPIDGLEKYILETLNVPDDAQYEPKAMDAIVAAYHTGPGAKIPGVYGTYWGAYNAVTDWVDHIRGNKGEAMRLDAAWFGSGVRIKQRAYELAVN